MPRKPLTLTPRLEQCLAALHKLVRKHGNQICLQYVADDMRVSRERARQMLRSLDKRRAIRYRVDPALPYHQRMVVEIVK